MPTLQWWTRNDDVKAADAVPYRLLEEVPELGAGDPDAGNMLIQGDNLEALKALLPYYTGQVKCIYIDPPFNTGQAFTNYDDNLEHSIWLGMMVPRLSLLRDLLTEDGTLIVHLDDNELAYATVVLDELFGRKNRCYIVSFKQGAATGHKAINPGMVSTTNFILVYAKDKGGKWKPNRGFVARPRDKRYGSYITNFEEPFENWRFQTVASAFATRMQKKTAELRKELGKDGYETAIEQFVLQNAERVVRLARPDIDAVGEAIRKLVLLSEEEPEKVYLHQRNGYPDVYLKGGERILFYVSKLKEIDGERVSGEPLTTLWDDLLSNNLHNEGSVAFPKGKKPEALIKRCFDVFSQGNDVVLDSFLGSGTTAAVAHKMGRRYIGIEMGDHAKTHCQLRLRKVIEGEQGGISRAVGWEGGGGFRFFRLGPSVFDEAGQIRSNIEFDTLAAHVWFSEMGKPWDHSSRKGTVLGIKDGKALALLYNGVLKDRSVDGGNVLTRATLKVIRQDLPDGLDVPLLVYGERCILSDTTLERENITFKQTPYDVKARA